MTAWHDEHVGLARCFAIISRTVSALVVPMSFSFSVGTFGGGVGRRHALNVLEDELAAQHRRRAVRIRGGHQHGALAEQAPARGLLAARRGGTDRLSRR